MKVTIVPILIGTLGTVIKKLIKRPEDFEIIGLGKNIQTTALLKSARILRRLLEIEETCCHPSSRKRPSANADVQKFQEEIKINWQ